MAKNKRKLGMFSIDAKTSFQKDLRNMKRQSLLNKDESKLSKEQKKWVEGASALRTKNYTKAGTNIVKGMQQKPIIGIQGNGATGLDPAVNLNSSINSSGLISIKDFMPTTPTGVYSQSDVKTGVSKFVSQLKETPSVQSVNLQTGKNNFGQVNVGRDYQKAIFDLNTKNLEFSTKGWQLDIPDNFIKKSDILYVSPTQEYIKDYYYKKDDGDRKKDIDRATFTPIQIQLQEGKNKIAKILKFDTYKSDDYSKKMDDYKKATYTKDVYLDEQKLFDDKGFLTQKKDWDDYTTNYELIKEDDYKREKEKKDIFLKSQYDYSPDGYLSEFKQWDDYAKREKTERGDNERYENVQGATYLREQQTYDDAGKIINKKSYDDYVKDEDYDYGVTARSDIIRDVALQQEDYFDAGKKIGTLKYGTYVEDVDVDKGRDLYRINPTGIGSVRRINPLISSNNLRTENTQNELFSVESDKTNIDRNTALQEIIYYDPFTGEPVEREKIW